MSSVASIPAFPSMLDRSDGEPAQDAEMRLDADIYTQPVARKPLDSHCGDSGDDGGAIESFEQVGRSLY